MIFAVNTTTEQFGLALMSIHGTIVAEYTISSKGKNYQAFMPAVDSILASSKTDTQKIQAMVVAVGPGSFTGLRVGLSMAKGLAQSLDIPIIGIPSLEAMANQLSHMDYPICPLITSRKGEVFLALFERDGNHELVQIKEEISIRIDDIPTFIDKTTLFVGNDFLNQSAPIKDSLRDLAILAPPHLWSLKASSVGSLGLKRFLKQDFDDLQDLVPTYLRPPDIRPNPFPLLSSEAEHSNHG